VIEFSTEDEAIELANDTQWANYFLNATFMCLVVMRVCFIC
jgi:acyl-CoA reductase-like NAD-dependent aldehyde dehydrogenase